MTNPPAGTAAPPSSTTGDPPPSNAELENRLDRVEGALGRIEQAITGGARGDGHAGQTGQGPGGAPGGQGAVDAAAIQRQVLEQIQEADRRRAAEQTETKWRDGVNAVVDTLRRERMPREPETGLRGVLQRALIGRPRG